MLSQAETRLPVKALGRFQVRLAVKLTGYDGPRQDTSRSRPWWAVLGRRGSTSERACHVISLCCGAGYQSRLELVLCARNETIEVSEGRLLVKASPRHGCIAFGEFYNPTTKLCGGAAD